MSSKETPWKGQDQILSTKTSSYYFLEFPLNKENEAERFRKWASKLTHATCATGIFNFGISKELPKHQVKANGRVLNLLPSTLAQSKGPT